MKLTVRQAAAALGVPETRIYRWIEEQTIPHTMVQHHPTFHRLEILEWALEMELPVTTDLYDAGVQQPLSRALARGGVRPIAAVADLVAGLPLDPAEADLIRDVIAAREDAMFRARADGIAIPRARSPIVSSQAAPAVVLGYAGNALSIAGGEVRAVFAIVAPTIKQHLQLLSRLSLVLHDLDFCAAVQRQTELDRLVDRARQREIVIEAGP